MLLSITIIYYNWNVSTYDLLLTELFLILCYSLQWTSFHQWKAIVCHISTIVQSFITPSRRSKQKKSTNLLLLSYLTTWVWTQSNESVGTWYTWAKWQWHSFSISIVVVISQCTNWNANVFILFFLKLWIDNCFFITYSILFFGCSRTILLFYIYCKNITWVYRIITLF
jgi:hypothetical protein